VTIAYHEAGHTVTCVHFGILFDVVVIRNDGSGGVHVRVPAGDNGDF
jgi:hypothetical protein